jgi:hypothetical protein
MIDREELRGLYRASAIKCALIAAVPIVAVVLALWLGPGQSSGPDALTPDPLTLAILGVGCVLPFGVVPWLRRSMRRSLAVPATPAEATAAHAASVASVAIVECDAWVAPSVFGLLAVMEGGSMIFAFVGFAISVAGVAYSFPRWSAVAARADYLESPRVAMPLA